MRAFLLAVLVVSLALLGCGSSEDAQARSGAGVQPDSEGTQGKGTNNPPSDGTPDNRALAETNGSKPPATGTNETDESTTSPKDDRPE